MGTFDWFSGAVAQDRYMIKANTVFLFKSSISTSLDYLLLDYLMFNWSYRKGTARKEEPAWTRSRLGVIGITSTQPKASLFSFFFNVETGQGWTEAQCTTERDRWREGRKRWLEEEKSKERPLSAVTWHGHTRVWKALWRAAVQLHILWFSVKRRILEECVQVREWENDRTECVCGFRPTSNCHNS